MFVEEFFDLGHIVATPGALEALNSSDQNPAVFVKRHASGDWGEIDQEDRESNEQALMHGERLLSAYATSRGQRLWVITEADRSGTCILLPEEY